jgi:plasmid maintenance system antidote protein VapI
MKEVTQMNVSLKVAFVSKGVRQIEAAQALNLDPAKLSKIVNGWIQPDHQTKQKLSRYLGESVNNLFPATQTGGCRDVG